jgi:SAM-dependent methyltransferase
VAAVRGSIEGSPERGRPEPTRVARVRRSELGAEESVAASRAWWDHDADAYLAEHGSSLGDVRLQWGPEGLDEETAGLLGPVTGLTVVEVGCGAGQGSRWLRTRGARTVGVDVSAAMLDHARRLDHTARSPGRWVQGDALRLPFRPGVFDLAFSSYGALPFVPDLTAAFAEVARVLRPGGRWVFSLTHPFRWCFRDDPGPGGLVVERSYFDRRAYVEEDDLGRPVYVEHHHTVGDVVAALVASRFEVTGLVEPQWPDEPRAPWGAWSPLRGHLLPGTAVFSAALRA